MSLRTAVVGVSGTFTRLSGSYRADIASFLVDPYKRDREAHAEVWQKIRVQRCVYTTSVVYDADFTQEHQCEYIVHDICCSDDASIPTATFGVDDMSGEWDNVEQMMELYNPDGSVIGTTYEWYNYQHDQY